MLLKSVLREAVAPLQWGELQAQPPLVSSEGSGWTRALLRRWAGISSTLEQPPLDHHLVALHLGGPKRVHRRGDGASLSRTVECGAVTIVPAGTAFSWQTEGPVDFAHLYLAPRMIERLIIEEFDRETRGLSFIDGVGERDPLLEAIFYRMLGELEEPIAPRLFLDSLLCTFAIQLLSRHSTLPTAAPAVRYELTSTRLKRVLDFADAHLADKMSLRDLAKVAGRSPYHFSRAFRRATGFSPYRYVIHRRIDRAKALLQNTRLPLADIAAQCGFNSQRQFAAMFKQVTGVSPARFRQAYDR